MTGRVRHEDHLPCQIYWQSLVSAIGHDRASSSDQHSKHAVDHPPDLVLLPLPAYPGLQAMQLAGGGQRWAVEEDWMDTTCMFSMLAVIIFARSTILTVSTTTVMDHLLPHLATHTVPTLILVGEVCPVFNVYIMSLSSCSCNSNATCSNCTSLTLGQGWSYSAPSPAGGRHFR